eukprot:TRINITY_DN8057_c0_g1_i1.p2 TRINITY_DN8057_c0_g1~~TRINITY_DN8057_c0_g1_i1.p2  ORF type:complete len:295 (+),score=108.35 TRINITY_DN8057_c0_g1_i1:74-958(+)
MRALRVRACILRPGVRAFSLEATEGPLLRSLENRVVTVKFNNPKRLNAWTFPLMKELRSGLSELGKDDRVGAVVLTGSGNYYSAGVSLSDAIKPMMPRTLARLITENNQALFDAFLDFPKPILIAANGPAIGATVTSATLCDGIVASTSATFHTPFTALGVTPEGCSSVHFERLLGKEAAERMLGKEGWKPTAEEAHKIGMVMKVVPDAELLPTAQAIAEKWIADGRVRTIPANGDRAELKAVNAKESVALAQAFLSENFLRGQQQFLSKRGKTGPAMMFQTIRTLRPIWSLLL